MNQRILNAKEKKRISSILKDQFGYEDKLDYIFLINDDNRVYIMNRLLEQIDFERLRVNTMGLYIGELHEKEIRLTIEGSQVIGPYAKKNVVEISPSDGRKWMRGEEIPADQGLDTTFMILKSGDDFLGTGKRKGQYFLNYVPKTRRDMSSDPI